MARPTRVFGSGGSVVFEPRRARAPNALALQDDGRIIGAGWTSRSGGPGDKENTIAVTRYTADGAVGRPFSGGRGRHGRIRGQPDHERARGGGARRPDRGCRLQGLPRRQPDRRGGGPAPAVTLRVATGADRLGRGRARPGGGDAAVAGRRQGLGGEPAGHDHQPADDDVDDPVVAGADDDDGGAERRTPSRAPAPSLRVA